MSEYILEMKNISKRFGGRTGCTEHESDVWI